MPDVVWQYVKALNNASSVEDFENDNGILFPIDLKECIKRYNGGRPSKRIFNTDRSKEREFKCLLSFNESDMENIYMVSPAINSINNNLIPFASDPSGNILCCLNGLIVLYLHETNALENVADSFSEFLDKLYSF